MPEGEQIWGPVVIGGHNLPSPDDIGLTDLPYWGPPWPLRFRHHCNASLLTQHHLVAEHIKAPQRWFEPTPYQKFVIFYHLDNFR